MTGLFGAAAVALFVFQSAPGEATSVTQMDPASPIISEGWSADDLESWAYLEEELALMALHQRLTDATPPRTVLFRNVKIIPMTGDGVRAAGPADVLVEDGQITQVISLNTLGGITPPDGALIVEAQGHYLMPGLADMHVHTLTSVSQHLLNLLHGVTSVRDMDGFPFTLTLRDAINDGTLLAPSYYVSGTILNGWDMGGYARGVRDADQGRAAVQDQAAAGYDFIKVHNSLYLPMFEAIAEEAEAQGLDLVGHVPMPVSVEEGLAAGIRTIEHFKGYVREGTYEITDEDYTALTAAAEVWNTPTLVTYRTDAYGEDAAGLLASDDMRFVSPLYADGWQARVTTEPDEDDTASRMIPKRQREVFRTLIETPGTRFLSGTDAGALTLMIPGATLIEELQLFETLGMEPYRALGTATREPALAMRRDDFGTIAPGMRADLILLSANPLESTENLETLEGVMARGRWLDAAALDTLEADLLAVYGQTSDQLADATVTGADLNALLSGLVALDDSGYPFMGHVLELAATLYDRENRPDDAATVRAMKTDPDFGFSWMVFE